MSAQNNPSAELQARWDKIRVANVYDTLDSMGYGNQCLDLGIRPLFPRQHLAGRVITVRGSAYPVPHGEEAEGWTGNYFDELRTVALSRLRRRGRMRRRALRRQVWRNDKLGSEAGRRARHRAGCPYPRRLGPGNHSRLYRLRTGHFAHRIGQSLAHDRRQRHHRDARHAHQPGRVTPATGSWPRPTA